MLGITRIIAFDDKQEDLDALVSALNGAGAACIGFRYTGPLDQMNIKPCPYVRVVFMDVNLLAGTATDDYTSHFSNIGELLRTVAPKGPYLLVLWTWLDHLVEQLLAFLDERLEDTPRPFDIISLPKEKYIDAAGTLKNPSELEQAIKQLTGHTPVLAALFDWEQSVSSAAAETLSSVAMLGNQSKTSIDQKQDIPRLVDKMANEAVGKDNVASNRFRAVNEAFLPLLSDHVSASQVQDSGPWEKGFSQMDGDPTLSAPEAARLNWAFHIAQDIGTDGGAERGAVIPLHLALPDKGFKEAFGIEQNQAADSQFRCKNFDNSSPNFRWVLVQVQAACDFAQKQPGPLPFCLGLEFRAADKQSQTPPAAVWTSPPFEVNNEARLLRVNCRFQVSIPIDEVKTAQPIYRLRETLLADLLHRAHTNGVRPGVISFEGAN